eukprot:SAG31_NODE_2056_length_6546_cov_1.979060_9_plen_129_part_00
MPSRRLDLYNRVFAAQAQHFDPHYRTKVQGEYQWAKFELARAKPAPRRKNKPNDNAHMADPVFGGDSNCQQSGSRGREALSIDLEEEMQGLFGDSDEDFEDAEWSGTEWIDRPATTASGTHSADSAGF